jgi:tetratricopeptide (TPR) repeat protein
MNIERRNFVQVAGLLAGAAPPSALTDRTAVAQTAPSPAAKSVAYDIERLSLDPKSINGIYEKVLVGSRWPQKVLIAVFVCLGLLKGASSKTDDIEGCTNASNLVGAVAACTRIIESNWANDHQVALAFNNRANANDALGYSDAAIDDYSRALAIDPHYGNALYNRGSTYLEIGKLDLATADFVAVLELNPSFAFAYNKLGVVRRTTGDFAQAITDLSRAIELMPTFAAALNNRGEVFLIEHRYAEAVHDFADALAIDPRHAAAARNLAVAKGLLSVDGHPLEIHDDRK